MLSSSMNVGAQVVVERRATSQERILDREVSNWSENGSAARHEKASEGEAALSLLVA